MLTRASKYIVAGSCRRVTQATYCSHGDLTVHLEFTYQSTNQRDNKTSMIKIERSATFCFGEAAQRRRPMKPMIHSKQSTLETPAIHEFQFGLKLSRDS